MRWCGEIRFPSWARSVSLHNYESRSSGSGFYRSCRQPMRNRLVYNRFAIGYRSTRKAGAKALPLGVAKRIWMAMIASGNHTTVYWLRSRLRGRTCTANYTPGSGVTPATISVSDEAQRERSPRGNFLSRQKVTKELPRGDAECHAPACQAALPWVPLWARTWVRLYVISALDLVRWVRYDAVQQRRCSFPLSGPQCGQPMRTLVRR